MTRKRIKRVKRSNTIPNYKPIISIITVFKFTSLVNELCSLTGFEYPDIVLFLKKEFFHRKSYNIPNHIYTKKLGNFYNILGKKKHIIWKKKNNFDAFL